jgi:hypothetical protein
MNFSRIVENFFGRVYPVTGGGNPQTGEVWSQYADGTIRSGIVWNEVPGTVDRYETYRKAASGWQSLPDEQKEHLQSVIDASVLNEDKINLQYADDSAKRMYAAGVNAPAGSRRLRGAT